MDFFGVICSEIAPFWLAKHLPESEAIVVKAEVVGAADRGELSQHQLFESLSKITGTPADIIENEWLEYVHIDHRIVEMLREWRNSVRIVLLTNSPAPLLRKIITDNNSIDLFHAIVVSSEQGIAKPDRRIYEIALGMVEVRPGECLMIDDNQMNIQGAISAGMRGLLFSSYEQLQRELSDEIRPS